MVDAIGGNAPVNINLGESNLGARPSTRGQGLIPPPEKVQTSNNRVSRPPEDNNSAEVAKLEAQMRAQAQKLDTLAAKVQSIEQSSQGPAAPSGRQFQPPGQITDILA